MAAGRVLVYGGKGALGSTVVSTFKSKSWWVLSVDLFANEDADANVVISETQSWTTQGEEVAGKVQSVVGDDKLDAVVCVAGGWAGGNAASQDLVKSCDLMWKQSVWTSVLAAQISSKHLREGGLLLLTGAQAALGATSGMIGYGLAKAAVHQLVSSLGAADSGLPTNTSVLAILPITLDTPGNRKGMANADFSQWTPLQYLADVLVGWAAGRDRPSPSPALLEVKTVDGNTTITPV
ncbi:Dihydropteridine reductase [Geodia barretti]|uniref:Dihydropteridine reductase n=1 Tax=Geodia barretti TaxID=519541 RepID=A0AA35SIV9_GEOBA|nr:Dihydropteridine reductase [Geodia barretti]